MKPKRITVFWLAIALMGQTISAEAWICNSAKFFEECPTTDPIFATIVSDFKIRKDGVLINAAALTCTPPISTIPISAYTDELVLLQALRAIYYMDLGRSNYLPWTPKALYGWLKEKVGGFEISTAADAIDQYVRQKFLSTGDTANYFVIRAKNDATREFQRKWEGLALLITLMMHERRHGDGIGHLRCCTAQDPANQYDACDQTYDESVNLSPYGIQYWLEKNWLSGNIQAGVGCMSPTAKAEAIQLMRSDANGKVAPTSNFCTNTPPVLNDTNNPPESCTCNLNGSTAGEPHLKTFDGLYYDFQAAGDFLLTTSGPSFIVQVRQQWTPNRLDVAFNKAVAMRMGKTRVAVFLDPLRLVVDGGQVALADGQTLSLPNNVEVSRTANVYVLTHGDEETVRVLVVDDAWVKILGGHFLDISVSLNYAASRPMRGLLGNGNRDVQDDIATRDGVVLAQPVPFKEFYYRYGASMHIKPEESLFEEDSRKGIFEAPKRPYTVRNLTPKKYETGRAACLKAGVRAKPLLDACTLDVAVLRSPAVAKLYKGVAAPVAVMEPGTGMRIMPSANTKKPVRNTSR
jgi:hypothetical protein